MTSPRDIRCLTEYCRALLKTASEREMVVLMHHSIAYVHHDVNRPGFLLFASDQLTQAGGFGFQGHKVGDRDGLTGNEGLVGGGTNEEGGGPLFVSGAPP